MTLFGLSNTQLVVTYNLTDKHGSVFWYLVKSDLSSVRYCTRVHWTSHVLQDPRNTRPCLAGHPVSTWCSVLLPLVQGVQEVVVLVGREVELRLVPLYTHKQNV